MTGRIRTILTVCIVAGLVTGPVVPCQAGPFLDWLFGRTPYYDPWRTVSYPPVSAPSSVCGVVGQPITSCLSGCGPTAPSYAPQVRYRTTWVPVPVTQYRPVMAADPMTGCPTSTLQPCTTYSWQIRRVPVVQYRPIYSCRPWWCSAPTAPMCAAPAVTTGMDGCAPMTIPSTQPYYVPPAGNTLVPGPTTVPGGGSPEPADTRPSLKPESPAPGPTAAPSALLLPPRSAAGASTSGGLLNPPAARPANIQPLPDPSAGPAEAPAHDPPRLLDPRDKTAMAPRWVVVPISWPAPEARVERLPVQAETSAPPVFDDRGWRSVHSN